MMRDKYEVRSVQYLFWPSVLGYSFMCYQILCQMLTNLQVPPIGFTIREVDGRARGRGDFGHEHPGTFVG